jgi:hypothetical protein
MTTYTVQFILPVDKPESNVSITWHGRVAHFDVPINHPDAHNMGYQDLLAAAELSGLLGLPTHLNNKKKVFTSKPEVGSVNKPDVPRGTIPPELPFQRKN